MRQMRVGVVGAGIIGLVSAWALHREGYDVTIFDDQPARGATWAAAGMLAPAAEVAPGEQENYRLQRDAVTRWQSWSAELLEVTGQQIQIHSVGTLLTGWDSSDRRLVQQSLGVMSDYGVTYKVLTRSDNPEDFEGLSDRITSGYLLDGDAWLDPDQAVSVLRAALELRSVPLIDERIATATLLGVKVRLETGDAKFDFDSVLFTTGSSPLPSSLATIESVRPIRGVTVRLKGLDRFLKPMVRSYVRGRPFYLVGRSEGYCVIGASAEEKATPTIETGEFYRLLRDALDVVPALDTAAWLETRVGHRPVAPSGEPFFDAHLDQRWAWSSGHYRHGVTLAPLASEWAVSFVRDLQRAD